MSWKSASLPSGSKLFKVHNFNFLYQGTNFHIEIDEYSDGTFTGHGENATDQSYVIESVSGKTLEECLSALLKKIEGRNP